MSAVVWIKEPYRYVLEYRGLSSFEWHPYEYSNDLDFLKSQAEDRVSRGDYVRIIDRGATE